MSLALIDTDVLLKTTSYQVLKYALISMPFGSTQFAIIAAARFVVAGKLKRKLNGEQLEAAQSHFQEALNSIEAIEPSPDELAIAAQLEAAAVALGVDLDAGESQLCALMLARGVKLMMTGDKRAIKAISALTGQQACAYAHGKVACLEQLVLWIVESRGLAEVQPSICTLPFIDRSLTVALGCHSGGASLESCREGLVSYINSIREHAPGVLIAYPG